MISNRNRIDPSLMNEEELHTLRALLAKPGHVALIDDEGIKTQIPKELYSHITRIIGQLSEGKAVVMMPVDEQFTTQAAANYLGVSRQHLVDLLEKGEIHFHKTGTHRRIAFKDLLKYEEERDSKRHKGLNNLFGKISEKGEYKGDFKEKTR